RLTQCGGDMVLETLMALVLLTGDGRPPIAGDGGAFVVWIVDEQDAVPASGRDRMRHEVERIWSPYGVELHWCTRLSKVGEGSRLTLLLSTTDDEAPLGRVARVGDFFRRQIVVSDVGVQHLLRANGFSREDALWTEYYARMFGRVVAHELGHLLLNS